MPISVYDLIRIFSEHTVEEAVNIHYTCVPEEKLGFHPCGRDAHVEYLKIQIMLQYEI